MALNTKRIYDPAGEEDGIRILVDRLWPRGISKDVIHIDIWMKEIAPSPGLRKWFDHQAERFEDFRIMYLKEIEYDQTRLNKLVELRELSKEKTVTLLTAAKELQYNHARVLKDIVEMKRMGCEM